MTSPRQREAWSALQVHFPEVRDLHLREVFAADRLIRRYRELKVV
jgi:hypothetical protein